MFERLDQLPRSDALDAVYYAVRLLKHHKGIDDLEKGLLVPGAASEPSGRAVVQGTDLVREIETKEGAPLKSIEPDAVAKYVVALSKYVGDRNRRELDVDESQ